MGGVQLARTGELPDNTEPRRGRVHRPGEVQVSRVEDPHEEAATELRGEGGARRRRETYSGVRVTADGRVPRDRVAVVEGRQ